MAKAKLKCIFFLVAISYVLSDRFVGGRRIGITERKELVKHKGTLKTIEGKDGDFIDCVDIYQQPAFDHQLLKNHIIQMQPDSIPNVRNEEFYDTELLQGLLENGECPEGTIPIRRHAQENEYYHALRSIPSIESLDSDTIGYKYTYSGVNLFGANYTGAHAIINVWNPAIADGDISIAQVALSTNHSNITNSIHAGWFVNSQNKEPKLFIYWTGDESQTGCYNLQCPGFVQVTQRFVLGSSLKPVSSYQGRQYSIKISIFKNMDNWWLQVHDQVLGYWPTSIFTHLGIGATAIYWGGAIHDSRQQGNHTTTPMGSGHLPNEGFGNASYFRNIQYMDGLGIINDTDPRQLVVLPAETPLCYGTSVVNTTNEGFGTHFYFGGPGCP